MAPSPVVSTPVSVWITTIGYVAAVAAWFTANIGIMPPKVAEIGAPIAALIGVIAQHSHATAVAAKIS